MTILGISCYYHDSAACIIKDDQTIAAAAEERFSRKKHDNSFPQKAIEFCLDSLGIAANELDAIVFYEKPFIKLERVFHQHLENFPKSYRQFITKMGQWFSLRLDFRKTLEEKIHYFGKIYFIDHHLSHAASSYYLSNFNEAVIVTLDGVGEWATTTVGLGKNNKIKIDKEIHFPHSLGLLYSTLTTYLGFSANDAEYKVMGMAAYGNPKYYRNHFKKIIKILPDGSFVLDMDYFSFDWSEKQMFSSKLIELFELPPRGKESYVCKKHAHIAAALQEALEKIIFNLLNNVYKKYQINNLCLSGGVALNSVMNGKILNNTPFKNLFIPPDPSDAGGAMGAALYLSNKFSDKKKNQYTGFKPYLGPEYKYYQIRKILDQNNLKYIFYTDREELINKVSDFIIDEKVIGWFQGKMEWGPRALGNRSILASARTKKMRDIINLRVKHREMFRPFAPVILKGKTKEYFDFNGNLPLSTRWMLMVYPFKKIGYKNVPAVVHVDGSGRLETLVHEDNPLYYDLLQKYYQKTGIPIIINTSFNVRGEPIICNPQDAINCFLNTDIDYLVIDSFILKK